MYNPVSCKAEMAVFMRDWYFSRSLVRWDEGKSRLEKVESNESSSADILRFVS